MQSLRILVTGGAGFIGSHLVDRLMKEGHEVMVLDNFYAGKVENIQQHFDSQSFNLVKGDIRNSKDVKKAVGHADVVYHLAAIVNVPVSIEDPLLVNDVNVRGTLNLLEASVKEDIQRFIYVSTCAVYGEAHYLPINEEHPIMPLSPYGISKFTAEHHCKIFHMIHGLKTVCLRFFNVYGPKQSEGPYSGVITQFINRLKQGKPPIIYGDGKQTRDFVFAVDVIDACMCAMRRKNCVGEVINVGTGVRTSINKLANVLAELLNLHDIKVVYSEPRAGDVRRSCADLSRAERLLGYNPKTSLREGLRMMLRELE